MGKNLSKNQPTTFRIPQTYFGYAENLEPGAWQEGIIPGQIRCVSIWYSFNRANDAYHKTEFGAGCVCCRHVKLWICSELNVRTAHATSNDLRYAAPF